MVSSLIAHRLIEVHVDGDPVIVLDLMELMVGYPRPMRLLRYHIFSNPGMSKFRSLWPVIRMSSQIGLEIEEMRVIFIYPHLGADFTFLMTRC